MLLEEIAASGLAEIGRIVVTLLFQYLKMGILRCQEQIIRVLNYQENDGANGIGKAIQMFYDDFKHCLFPLPQKLICLQRSIDISYLNAEHVL